MGKLSLSQEEALIILSKPCEQEVHHSIFKFDGRTIHSLEKRKFVEFYRPDFFKHGAVRLSKEGKKYVEKLKRIEQQDIAV